MIDPAVLEAIQAATDIAALISEHVALKRSGRGFLGLCPFHQEKTPSFHVDPERGFFHCFGCNAGGNCFTFLTRLTGAGFRSVVAELAQRAGIQVATLSEADRVQLVTQRSTAKAARDEALSELRHRWRDLARRLDDARRRANVDPAAIPERDELEGELEVLDVEERAIREGRTV